MNTPQEFEVFIRRRLPFFSSFFFGAALFFLAVLFILYLIILPSRHSSLEIQTAYFILATPEALKRLVVYSTVGLPIVFWLYYSLRLYKPAILTFHAKTVSIVGKNVNLDIPFRKIEKVYCKGLFNLSGRSKASMKVVLVDTV